MTKIPGPMATSIHPAAKRLFDKGDQETMRMTPFVPAFKIFRDTHLMASEAAAVLDGSRWKFLHDKRSNAKRKPRHTPLPEQDRMFSVKGAAERSGLDVYIDTFKTSASCIGPVYHPCFEWLGMTANAVDVGRGSLMFFVHERGETYPSMGPSRSQWCKYQVSMAITGIHHTSHIEISRTYRSRLTGYDTPQTKRSTKIFVHDVRFDSNWFVSNVNQLYSAYRNYALENTMIPLPFLTNPETMSLWKWHSAPEKVLVDGMAWDIIDDGDIISDANADMSSEQDTLNETEDQPSWVDDFERYLEQLIPPLEFDPTTDDFFGLLAPPEDLSDL